MKHAMTRLAVGFAVAVLLAIVTSPVAAQTGKLTGVVTDAESGAPLEGAQILLQGTGISALTGTNGRYFIVNVPPSTYTVVVRRIGYASAEVRNVLVQIDVTRNIDVELSPAGAVGVEDIVVTAEATPLIQPGVTGSGTNIQTEEISALPVTNIQGVLALQQGFFEVPQNTDIVSFTETRRNPIEPIRIRGGRAGETLTLIDGIPINNFVFGGPAFNITTEAVEQIDFQRGGFEPQYGNALSGIINIATKEGGSDLAGAVSFQTSAVGGALGNTHDELANFDLYQGFISGPVPATNNRVRFMIAGRNETGADRVIEFDDEVRSYSDADDQPSFPARSTNGLDLFPGWRAFGYDNIRDVFGKMTFYLQPTLKLSVSAADYRRQRQGFDFDYLLSGFNALEAPAIDSYEDSLRVEGGTLLDVPGFQDIVQNSIDVQRRLYTAKWDHTIGRWAYKLSGGYLDQERESCSFFQGICMGRRIADVNFTGDRFVDPGVSEGHPSQGTDEFFGGEQLKTVSLRMDIQGQATDHHNVALGAFYQRHDLDFIEWRNQGVNDVLIFPQFYRAEPWEAAFYLQDKIEYDFLTVKLGARFDFGKAGGLFFADPRNPTNGTTAREVCEGEYPGVARFTGTDENGNPVDGFTACALNSDLLAEATAIAQGDDFAKTESRTQFSPRIGVSFPLTERSSVFFNFGRYSQNPLYNNLFQNTGIGTVAGDDDGVCAEADTVPGSNGACVPTIFSDIYRVSFLGNPNLLIEKTTSYELGFATEIGRDYALSVLVFSKDQFGLTGIRQGGRDSIGTRFFDVGATYGTSTPDYFVIVNQDFQTVRGFEIQFRRRLSNLFGFNINYAFSQARTNAAAPDIEQELQDPDTGGLEPNLQEIPSSIDQPHVFNASLVFRVGNEEPFGNGLLNALVRNSNASVTLRASSGLPYTPIKEFFGGINAERLSTNSARGPATWQIDLLAGKDFSLANMRYGAFVRVVNLLDTKNCIQVFNTTGRCDAGTVDQSRLRQGNTAGLGTTTTFFDRAHFFGQRRSVNAGLRITF